MATISRAGYKEFILSCLSLQWNPRFWGFCRLYQGCRSALSATSEQNIGIAGLLYGILLLMLRYRIPPRGFRT